VNEGHGSLLPDRTQALELGGLEAGAEAEIGAARPTRRRRVLRQLVANPVSAAGLVLTILLVLVAIAAPLLAARDPLALDQANRLLPPSEAHLFGTDEGGRDIFSRVLYGARSSLFAAAVILALATVIGTTIGLAAGYLGGRVDEALMRVTDMFLAFPALVLAMGAAAALGPSLLNATIATGIVWWPWYARLVRGQTLQLKYQPFVEAGVLAGGRGRWILLRHILPNCLTPIIVQMSLDVGYAILTLASLSFIGLGAQPPAPEWGSMIAIGRDYILDQPWYVTFPGLAIFVAVMAFNLLGDGLQEALSPRLQRA
jgi:peptide/nickel transport system permease protein